MRARDYLLAQKERARRTETIGMQRPRRARQNVSVVVVVVFFPSFSVPRGTLKQSGRARALGYVYRTRGNLVAVLHVVRSFVALFYIHSTEM